VNVLIYDEHRSLCDLLRGALIGAGHRASISSDAPEAIRKLDTALFDAVLVGRGGAPRKLAEYLDNEMPHMPILLAGITFDGIESDLRDELRRRHEPQPEKKGRVRARRLRRSG
jgi:hypothetical protein